ncbi:oligoendopeptidase F [Streptococcus azizii]|uniref:Oligoendopeptidase F n=1 Tax=Streptococcus azizii TaxID=1579424 RepID=A0AB36JNK6_9STRE|nr:MULTISPECIES: oligoendopeptidase F [Streptococcus]MBF0776127.1 oligoendopeptidase F [Streptococcus sp. 19428wD3_AN2]ONK26902.1 oligoendopeptidase F [Streptococcus azizii]ONK27924.1 oligoendopeptidase F [Streptococcus azizii]ONK28768.1 oligoendopeptidase F [Streptococcus azizii]TFU83473.1 oligoendopeptidase F [Streptococcus sp. AN2]
MTNAMPKRQDIDASLTWDTSLIYPSHQAYQEALAAYKVQVEQFEHHYKDKLTSVEVVIEALKEYEAIRIIDSKLSHYAFLNLDVDKMNTELAALANEYQITMATSYPKVAFLQTQLALLEDDMLSQVSAKEPQWTSYINDILRQKPHQLHPLQEELLANFAPTFEQPYRQYETTKFEDMTFDNFTANGQSYGNSYVLFENDYEISHDTEIRRNAAASFYSTLKKYKNTTAADYLSHIKNEQIEARLRGFNSTIDYLLFSQHVSRDLFDRQIDVIMKELAPHMRRYVKLVAKAHGLDTITHADLKISLPSDFNQRITPEESKQFLIDCLGILGDDYIKMIEQAFDERWIDFAQNEGKATGGYCATLYDGPSYILLSWTGLMNEVLVLAHELGHAGHFQLAKKQSVLNYDPSLYFIEAPSTANEVLTCNTLLKQNQDPAFQAYLISELISRTYFHNMVTHLLEAAFQREVYTRLDRDEYLNGEILCQIKLDIIREFWGQDFEIGEEAGLIWMRQPHYYIGLYPYTYSAGLTIGTAMAKQLEENPEAVVEKWLETLSLGASLSAQDLAKHAGVDVSTDKPLRDTIAYVGSLVDRLEELM